MSRHVIAAVVLVGALAACSSGSSGGGGGGVIAGYQSCSADTDCPSGQGCDTEGGGMTDGYCTPLCSDDTGCPMGYDCPSGAKDQPGECDEVGQHTGGQGVCDQFDGASGPNTCTG